jgi:hypothetical protein
MRQQNNNTARYGRVQGKTVQYDDDVEAGRESISDGFVSGSTWIFWAFIAVFATFSAATTMYLIYYNASTSYNGGDHGQWNHIDSLDANVTSIWEFLNEQFQCMRCSLGLLILGDTYVNGTLLVKNDSSPAVDVVASISSSIYQIDLLYALIDALDQTVSQVQAAMRLEVENFAMLLSSEPDTQFIPFTGTGFYGYIRDPTGLFDTSNDNYTIVTRRAIIQASAQVYFSANATESYVLCFFMPFVNSTPGAEPTLMSGGGESINITAFGGFTYAGVVTMVGSFEAQAGWELNIRCAIAQGTPLDIIATSHLDLHEII